MKFYDFIIAGGGLAGLSLAYHLIHSPLRGSSILILDKDAKDRNDRTWCFWADRPTVFDDIVFRSWDRLRFVGEGFERVFDLETYRYQMIRGVDFYRHVRGVLSMHPNVEFIQGAVERIADGADAAHVTAGDRVYAGRWVFDSLLRPRELQIEPSRYRYLRQHFKGWIIETPSDAFDPHTPTLFDFRTPQNGSMRFVYTLPFSERRALIEYTLFSADLLKRQEYERGLRDYIESGLGIGDYRIVEEESGVIPMTDRPFPRRLGRRVMAIGAKGGRVKPSTGYAFLRVQRDSTAIVQSLLKNGYPFGVPRDAAWYRLHDAIMLEVMTRNGARMARIFTELFKNNPIERVFRFLDERGSPLRDAPLLASLPPWPFLRALARAKVLRRIEPSQRDSLRAPRRARSESAGPGPGAE
jgi:lycopene beta-cyclase